MSRLVSIAALPALLVTLACPPPAVTPDAGTGPDPVPRPDAGEDEEDAGPTPEDAGPTPEDAGPTDTPCEPTVDAVGALVDGDDLAVTADRLIVANGSVTAYQLNGTLVDELIAPTGSEQFVAVALGGAKVFATADSSGGSGDEARVAAAPLDGSAAATVYDVSTYADYQAAVISGPYAFSPNPDLIVANDTHVFIQERTYGGLLVFTVEPFAPVAFFVNNDTNRPLYGASAMLLVGDKLVAMIDRQGIGVDSLRAIRVISVATPTTPAIVGQLEVDVGTLFGLAHDAAAGRFYFTDFGGAGGGVQSFTVASDGTPSAIANDYFFDDRQAREILVHNGVIVVATPDFDPAELLMSFLQPGTPATLLGSLVVPAGVFGNAMVATGTVVFASDGGGGGVQRIDLSSCLD